MLFHMSESVPETHLYLTTEPRGIVEFEDVCSKSIFSSIMRPTAFFLRQREKPANLLFKRAFAGKAQWLVTVTLALGALQRWASSIPYVRIPFRTYNFLTAGTGFWTLLSILAFLGPGKVDQKTSSLVIRDPNLYGKLAAAVITGFIPLLLATFSVPQMFFVLLYKLSGFVARLGAVQHALHTFPAEQPAERVEAWRLLVKNVNTPVWCVMG